MKKKKLKNYPLKNSPLYKLSSRSKLAKLLQITQGNLRRIIKNSPYREGLIPKADGTERKIEKPNYDRKEIQKTLSQLLMRIEQPEYLFCPVKGRGYMDAVKVHSGKRVISSIDIKKFYPNTDARRVFWFFNSVMECPADIAGLLTSLCSYNGHLPTGSPSSPIVALFSYKPMWEEIFSICEMYRFSLSIYVDDIIISGDEISKKQLFEIKRVISKYGFKYHKEKIVRDGAIKILGLIVKGEQISLPNKILKKLYDAREARTDEGEKVIRNYSHMQKQLACINA